MKPLLLGEAPNYKAQQPGEVLQSLAPRLCEFAGLVPGKGGAYPKLLEYFDVANAYDGDGWSRPIARERVFRLILSSRPKVVVCLGRRASDTLDVPLRRWNWWQMGYVLYDNGSIKYPMNHKHEFLLATIPHPSGKCRVYNDLDERQRAHFTLRQALEAAERLSRGERLPDVARTLLPERESRSR